MTKEAILKRLKLVKKIQVVTKYGIVYLVDDQKDKGEFSKLGLCITGEEFVRCEDLGKLLKIYNRFQKIFKDIMIEVVKC